jgi:hypothetical protein
MQIVPPTAQPVDPAPSATSIAIIGRCHIGRRHTGSYSASVMLPKTTWEELPVDSDYECFAN